MKEEFCLIMKIDDMYHYLHM